jgi:acetyl-CoA carboxylase beta subunit
MSCDRTSEEALEGKPKRCCACGKVMTREEVRAHPALCGDCAAVIDRQTEERKDQEGWG